ncbi:DUF6799 domain-containing protein [Puia sp.]|uniref:DUF6799 domain-containing protein n=1 Tax=Puia sp. TaxID=2045100 RepID=UPI002F40356E
MKKLTLFVVSFCFSRALLAHSSSNPPRPPRTYIMMVHGKLVEVDRGKRKRVKRDVTLINHSTIHPNGAIDAGSGESLQLREGQYITMDGKIRNLKDMGRH